MDRIWSLSEYSWKGVKEEIRGLSFKNGSVEDKGPGSTGAYKHITLCALCIVCFDMLGEQEKANE